MRLRCIQGKLDFLCGDVKFCDVFYIVVVPIEFDQPSHRGITY